MLGDVLAIFAGFAIAGYLRAETFTGATAMLSQLVLPVYLTIALYNDAYSIESLRSTSHSATRSLLALGLSAATVTFVTFYARSTDNYSRMVFTVGVVVSALFVLVNRVAMRRFVRWRCGVSVINQLVIDDGGPDITLHGAFHVSAQSFALAPVLDDPHALDRIGMIIRNADRVVISSVPERRANWSIILKGANVAGEVVDDTVLELSAQGARIANGHGLLLVSVGPMGLRDRLQKRMLDAFVAGSALFLLSPILLLVALAIKLEDGGPVFFIQRRVGRGNRFFPIFKFRSMSVNKIGQNGTQSAARDDKRITRVGKIIRSTSVDELPQLINVLRGDMSLVGPRPHATGSTAGGKLFWEVDPRYWERHALKPGLTGLAQIRGYRGATDREEDLTDRLYADLEYLHGWSLWRDIWIMLMTLRVVVHDRAF
ncbi:sugar transferase [Novosphingobium sediminicola]|uniref:Exopolysaccharide biosynthesis polyprenyl glycosylphosphotransferase n=1 Tax=Novosphingobium sediminicola TaxID=563162 RepID=A0A7W6CPK9_9SPHN|nr:sugar transferase [Novosphingobium sediminicola]MBB3956811.1 exopolysaccharide biosynthesis polyprenyl glycosylphosphotransferase [Novosphingobium sediminicola]